VNHRDLADFKIDADLATRMLAHVPNDVVVVAESGVRDVVTVQRLGAAGIDAVLVGETLMRAENLCATVSSFAAQPRRPR
jgi:indole-3-glycerol phosphate synthase